MITSRFFENWRRAIRTMFPPHFLHQMLQLRRPVARMIRAAADDRLLALFAPYMVAVALGTHDMDHLRVVFTIHEPRALAFAAMDLNGELDQFHLGQDLGLHFADTELFYEYSRNHTWSSLLTCLGSAHRTEDRVPMLLDL